MKILISLLIIIFSYFSLKAQTLVGNDTIKSSENRLTNKEEVPVVEELPQFPGGSNNMSKFIAENYNFPEKTIKKIDGKVYVSFLIDEEGKINQIQILKGIDKEIDDEILRVVSIMPAWKPATMNGRNVRVKMTIPIKLYKPRKKK